MIRYPERFHASVTPGTVGSSRGAAVEPNYQESAPAKKSLRAQLAQPHENHAKFDFSALEKWGRK